MKRPWFVSVRVAVVAGLTVAVALGTLVIWRSSQAMRSAAQDVRAENELGFTVKPLASARNTGFEAVSSPAVFLQAARYQDHFYIARAMAAEGADFRQILSHYYPNTTIVTWPSPAAQRGSGNSVALP
jgi:peptidoglycan hydrolase-like amidase